MCRARTSGSSPSFASKRGAAFQIKRERGNPRCLARRTQHCRLTAIHNHSYPIPSWPETRTTGLSCCFLRACTAAPAGHHTRSASHIHEDPFPLEACLELQLCSKRFLQDLGFTAHDVLSRLPRVRWLVRLRA